MMLIAALATLGLVATAPLAAADPCGVLDLGCTVEETGTTVGGVVEETGTTLGGVVEETGTTLGGVVEETGTTLGGVVEETGTTVGGIVEVTGNTIGDVVEGEGPIDAGPVVGGVVPGTQPAGTGDQPGSPEVPSGEGTPPGGGSPTDPGGAAGGSDPTLGVASPVTPGLVGVGILPGASGTTSAAVGHPFPEFIDEGSGSLSGARVARTLAFPLMLILLVIAFLFAQDRIDRKDPKLALAPVEADHLTFS
jgi:hypothetical protein